MRLNRVEVTSHERHEHVRKKPEDENAWIDAVRTQEWFTSEPLPQRFLKQKQLFVSPR